MTNIDFSDFNKTLTAVFRYEAYRQMIVKLTDALSLGDASCRVSSHNPCIELYWDTNLLEAGNIDPDTQKYQKVINNYMSYDGMCDCCKRKQVIIDERKRCKQELGKAKRALSVEGKRVMKGFPEEGGESYNILDDLEFNPLQLKEGN